MMMDVDSDTTPRLVWETASAGKVTNDVRSCVTCKQTIPNYGRFKNCATCREKNRNKSRLAAQRRQERNLWAAQVLANLTDEEGGSSSGEENHVTRPGGAPSAKKKPKSISELDGKEREVALLEMKNGLKRKFGKMAAASSKPTQSSGKEYQTASALYDTLKRNVQASSASKLQFYGYHTIVANEEINNRKRTKMVVDDIRKIVRVPFDLAKVQKSQNANTNSYALTYSCACLGYDTTPAAAAPMAPANPSIKGTEGDLIRQARARLALSGAGSSSMAGQPADVPAATVRRECGGKVYVITKDDHSHPLGILGQKISIRVQHT